jgi:hypothetical protein
MPDRITAFQYPVIVVGNAPGNPGQRCGCLTARCVNPNDESAVLGAGRNSPPAVKPANPPGQADRPGAIPGPAVGARMGEDRGTPAESAGARRVSSRQHVLSDPVVAQYMRGIAVHPTSNTTLRRTNC